MAAAAAQAVGLRGIDARTRLEERVGVATILRHPVSHFLSYYAYFIEPDDADGGGLKR